MKLIYHVDDYPPLDSPEMRGIARRFMHVLDYWKASRRPLELQWEENDKAYLCARRLPEMEGMQYIDQSDWGETDIFDGVNNLSLRLSLACMPKDESWLTVVGRKGELPEVVNAVQAQQIWMHRRSRTRRIFGRHLKQLIVRGQSFMYLRWLTEMKYRTLGPLQARRALKKYLKQTGADPEIVNRVNKVRVPETVFQGPAVRVLDTWDVWLDPEADMVCDRRPAMIVVTYIRKADLEALQDDNGDPMYDNLGKDESGKSLEPHKASDIYWGTLEGTRRLKALNNMGIRPQQYAQASTELVPVYTIYCHYFKSEEGTEFFDTYFHVAVSKDGSPRMIRIEENPSADGHRLILQDNFIEFFTNIAYGISGVEKLLSAWHQKNFMGALMLNAAAATAFPAYITASGVLKDDLGFNLTPGAINEITMAALSQAENIIRPIPTPQQGLRLAFEDMSYYKSRIAGGFETTGAYGTDQVADRETATSVNFRASNQGVAIDELSEKFGDTLQEVCQWAYDMSIQNVEPTRNEDGEKVVEFGQIQGNQVQPGELKFDDWAQPRSIEVLGLHGVMNRQQNIANKSQALNFLNGSAQYLPNAPALAQKLVKSLFQDLNIETEDTDWVTTQQLAAQDPNVEMMALEQGLQNKDLLQAVLQKRGLGNGAQAQGQPGQQQQPAGQSAGVQPAGLQPGIGRTKSARASA